MIRVVRLHHGAHSKTWHCTQEAKGAACKAVIRRFESDQCLKLGETMKKLTNLMMILSVIEVVVDVVDLYQRRRRKR